MKNRSLFLWMAILSFLYSCSNQRSENTKAIDDVTVENSNAPKLNVSIPNSVEVIKLLNDSGAGFIFDITNSPDGIDKYLTTQQKAINLGIYGADLTYTSIYQKQEETQKYLVNFKRMMDELHISTADKGMVTRIENNLQKKDSLVEIISKVLFETQQSLSDKDQDDVALLVLAGSWIEGIYLVGSTIGFAEDRAPLYKIVLKYRTTLTDLLKLMELQKDNPDFTNLYNSLNEINNLFIEIGDNSLNTDKIDVLKIKVITLRNSLI